MNCAEVKEHFEAAFDGALSQELEAALMLHKETCQSCQAAWDSLHALRSALRSSDIAPPSSTLDARVMQSFNRAHRQEEEQPKGHAWWQSLLFGSIAIPRPAFALALLAFVSLLALALYVGRLTATPITLTTTLPSAAEASAPPSQQIVYVPLEVESKARTVSPLAVRRATTPRKATSTPAPGGERPARQLESFTVTTATGTNYATKASLEGFEPVETASVRVIKGRGE